MSILSSIAIISILVLGIMNFVFMILTWDSQTETRKLVDELTKKREEDNLFEYEYRRLLQEAPIQEKRWVQFLAVVQLLVYGNLSFKDISNVVFADKLVLLPMFLDANGYDSTIDTTAIETAITDRVVLTNTNYKITFK